jgi:hypothetical protein
MSTFSEAWHTMDNKVREFYIAYSLINTYFCNPFDWDPVYRTKLFFYTFGTGWNGPRGIDVAMKNWTCQLWASGSFAPNSVLWSTFSIWDYVVLGPMNDPFWGSTFDPQFKVITDWAINYPRQKYRIRRSYWTGIPRRRRNLT